MKRKLLQNVFVVCFSLVNKTTLENLRTKWIPEVLHHGETVPIILVGTKKDLRDNHGQDYLTGTTSSIVTKEEAESFVESQRKKNIPIYAYVECSAKTQEGINEIFEEAVKAHRAPKPKKKKKRRRCILI